MNSSNRPQNKDQLKEQLTPPGSGSAPPQTGRRNALLTVMLVFAVLVGGAIGVLVFLPGEKPVVSPPPPDDEVQLSPPPKPAAAEPETAPIRIDESAQPVSPSPETEQADAARQAKEQAWALRIQADAENIDSWADEEYQQIVAQLEEADTLLKEQVWPEAEQKYQSALTDLQDLLDSKEQRYQQSLEEGLKSLAADKPEVASDFFNRALLINPSSPEAKNGLAQAEQLAALHASYQQALAFEDQGQLVEAMRQLEEILGSGPVYEPALQARERIQAQLDEELFQREMNALFSALKEEDFAAAGRSLQTLETLGLRRQEVAQAAALLADKQTRVEIERLKIQAETFSEEERWQQAADAYAAILNLDPDLLFAFAGRQEAAKRAELHRSMSDAVTRSHRLQDAGQRSAAASLLDYARRIEPQGPELQAQIEALDALLEKFRTPVTVALESNNQTQVTIYHVGRIAPFLTTEIELKPGTYTLVGSRAGYRDVRMQITVGPDTGDKRYDIRCEEAI
jgi:tetratricopeptide (TPR) repeat protein